MAISILGQRVSTSYGDLLQMSNSGNGIDGTLRNIADGKGHTTPLQISNSAINVTAFSYNGNAISLGGSLTTSSTVSLTGAVTTNGAVSFGGAVTIPNTFTISGNFPLTFNLSGSTTLTLPTSGTFVTTSAKLSAFAATTSAELATVVSDETGSGVLVYNVSPSITTPTITTPIIAQLNDANNAAYIKTTAATTAVNQLTIANAATGSGPSITATGSDTNIDLSIAGKGNATLKLGQASSLGVQLIADQPLLDSSANELIKFSKTASAVNELTVTNAATAGTPKLAATGGDTNIPLEISSKGTSSITLKTVGGTVPLIMSNNTNTLSVSMPTWTGNRTLLMPDQDIDLTPVVYRVYSGSNVTPGNNTFVKMAFDTEEIDTGSYYDNATNYRFLPLKAGYYYIKTSLNFNFTGSGTGTIAIYKNGGAVAQTNVLNFGTTNTMVCHVDYVAQLNGSSDYIEVYAKYNNQSNAIGADTTQNYVLGFKIH